MNNNAFSNLTVFDNDMHQQTTQPQQTPQLPRVNWQHQSNANGQQSNGQQSNANRQQTNANRQQSNANRQQTNANRQQTQSNGQQSNANRQQTNANRQPTQFNGQQFNGQQSNGQQWHTPRSHPTQPHLSTDKKKDPKSAKAALKRSYGDILKKMDSQFDRIESTFVEWSTLRSRREDVDDHSYDVEISKLFMDIRNGVNNIGPLNEQRHAIRKMIAECADE